MRMARKLGMMTYRSPEEWVQRFGRQRTTATEENVSNHFKPRFSVEAYLENHANKFSGGFDPNRWFGSVERIALEDVGPEPVRYVANINKYYVAYQLQYDMYFKRQKEIENLRKKVSAPDGKQK